MKKTEKVDQIQEIKDLLNESDSVYLVNYEGLDVQNINQIRSEFRQGEVKYKVFKNTLFKKAIDEVGGYESFNDLLEGMTGFAFSGENFVAPAKIIKKVHDDKGKLSLKGCYIESNFYSGDQLNMLASMPTKEEVMSGILSSINSPASGIVGAINAVMRDIVSLVDEISKKEAA